jgi:hypothetical protein
MSHGLGMLFKVLPDMPCLHHPHLFFSLLCSSFSLLFCVSTGSGLDLASSESPTPSRLSVLRLIDQSRYRVFNTTCHSVFLVIDRPPIIVSVVVVDR